MSVRQAGVTYPTPGTELVLGGVQVQSSAALLLQAACVLRQNACASIDGNSLNTDAITGNLAGSIASARAFSLAGAPIATPGSTGVRGLGLSLESRYRLQASDLRLVQGVVVPVLEPFLPASQDELLVRAEVLQVESSLLTDGTGLVDTSTIAIMKVVRGDLGVRPPARTLEVIQRGGLLRMPDGSVLGILPDNERPLVERRDYFMSLGRTSDNRWELRRTWRVIDGNVFAMNASRTEAIGPSAYAGTVDDFLAPSASTAR